MVFVILSEVVVREADDYAVEVEALARRLSRAAEIPSEVEGASASSEILGGAPGSSPQQYRERCFDSLRMTAG